MRLRIDDHETTTDPADVDGDAARYVVHLRCGCRVSRDIHHLDLDAYLFDHCRPGHDGHRSCVADESTYRPSARVGR